MPFAVTAAGEPVTRPRRSRHAIFPHLALQEHSLPQCRQRALSATGPLTPVLSPAGSLHLSFAFWADTGSPCEAPRSAAKRAAKCTVSIRSEPAMPAMVRASFIIMRWYARALRPEGVHLLTTCRRPQECPGGTRPRVVHAAESERQGRTS